MKFKMHGLVLMVLIFSGCSSRIVNVRREPSSYRAQCNLPVDALAAAKMHFEHSDKPISEDAEAIPGFRYKCKNFDKMSADIVDKDRHLCVFISFFLTNEGSWFSTCNYDYELFDNTTCEIKDVDFKKACIK